MTVIPDHTNACCYIIGGFGPIDGIDSDEDDDDEPDAIRTERQNQRALSLGLVY